MAERTVTARNWATTSENRIHDDEVARLHGFRGGLVPGVASFTYAVPAIVDDLGPAWLDGGFLDARLRSPVYEGDEVTAACRDGEVTVVGPGGETCLAGQAWLARAGILDRRLGAAPRPDPRPPASAEELAVGRRLATLHHRADRDEQARYLEAVGDDPAWWLAEGVTHPGWLLLDANAVLSSSVVLGPWIHVGSRLRLLGRVPFGADLEVRAEVVGQQERKGHHLVDLDVVTTADGRPALVVRHTALWQLRAPDAG